jgi:HEAT repeat protein
MYDRAPGFDDSFLYELARDNETTELVAHMKHGERPAVRRRAAELLGDFADVSRQVDQEEITRELITVVLEADDESVRARAIDSLYRHGREQLERLVTRMADFDASETPDWMTARQLVEWLDAEYPEFRMVAATALGEFGDEHAVSHLVDAFDDLDPRVRERAVEACGSLGDERAIDALAGRLDDREPRVRRAAANALAAISTEQALEALIPAARADDEQVRQIAVSKLGQFGSTKPLVVLVRALEDRSETVRRAAILSLVELVAASEESDDKLYRVVTEQLREADSADLIPQLIDILEVSARPLIRRHVVWLLGRVVDPEEDVDHLETVHGALLDVLDDEHLGDLAAESLVRLDSEQLEKRLRIFVQGEEGSTEANDRAEEVLEEIGSNGPSEVVRNSVDYTYVREPADYTRQKRDGEL